MTSFFLAKWNAAPFELQGITSKILLSTKDVWPLTQFLYLFLSVYQPPCNKYSYSFTHPYLNTRYLYIPGMIEKDFATVSEHVWQKDLLFYLLRFYVRWQRYHCLSTSAGSYNTIFHYNVYWPQYTR